MSVAHEGEILLKEIYGSSQWKRYYVKPPDQTSVVVVDEGKKASLSSWLKYVFLPQGYPDSVSKDYTNYQIWDTAQAFCSTIMGILATKEVLRGVGVGDEASTPLAATATWVFKDGCGHISRILFAYARGTHLDAYSKKWRLYADLLNDMAMCIEISLPAFKNCTTPALCVSSAMKAIVGVAGGASRIAMTQHQALRNNLADLSAKDSAQETAVNLVASFCALAIITFLGGKSMILFILLMVMHITCNYLAVRAVCLRTLNEPRYLQIINAYLRHEELPTPCTANRHEPIIFYQQNINCLDYKLCGFSITLGRSLKKLIKNRREANYLKTIVEVYKERRYLLYPSVSQRHMYVLLREGVTVEDVVVSYFHAVLLSAVICSVNRVPLGIFENQQRPFAELCQTLQASDWTRDIPTAVIRPGDLRYTPSEDLMIFVDRMVSHEKYRFFDGLVEIGWDLSKHLLLLDEWRIMGHTVNPAPNQNAAFEVQSGNNTLQEQLEHIINKIREDADKRNKNPEAANHSETLEQNPGEIKKETEENEEGIEGYPDEMFIAPGTYEDFDLVFGSGSQLTDKNIQDPFSVAKRSNSAP